MSGVGLQAQHPLSLAVHCTNRNKPSSADLSVYFTGLSSVVSLLLEFNKGLISPLFHCGYAEASLLMEGNHTQHKI